MSCVLVLGIPRSGTSAMAGALHRIGVNMGDDLMPAMPGVNDRGFYEDVEFSRLHDLLVRAHEDPQILFDVPHGPDAAFLNDWEKKIDERAKREWWGIKDPKMCFLLPYFTNRYRGDLHVVVMRRPFHESVASFRPLFGGMSLERAATIQARYLYSLERNLAAASKSGNFSTIKEVKYEDLVEKPLSTIHDLQVSLGLRTGFDELQDAVAFIDPRLKRA